MLVPHMHALFPHNAWAAVGLFALAAAAHQGWSATLFATPTDMFPSTSVSTVVGIGGAVGSLGGALFTVLVSHLLSLHPLAIFAMASGAYVVSLLIFQLLVPRIGMSPKGGWRCRSVGGGERITDTRGGSGARCRGNRHPMGVWGCVIACAEPSTPQEPDS